MAFQPGQWLNAFLPVGGGDFPLLKRSYSIASAPDGSPQFEIAVTRVQGGPGSAWLHAAGVGTTIAFAGPHGFFTRPAAAPPSLFVATGTGVTPMRSMLRASLAAGCNARTLILLGVRHEEDIVYANEFQALAAAHPFVRFEPTLSQPQSLWPGRRGYVQTHVRELWHELETAIGTKGNDLPHTPHAYVCGLERMVGSVRELLRVDMGVPRPQVHTERYD
jgi:ferredoxin-NADP reductase